MRIWYETQGASQVTKWCVSMVTCMDKANSSGFTSKAVTGHGIKQFGCFWRAVASNFGVQNLSNSGMAPVGGNAHLFPPDLEVQRKVHPSLVKGYPADAVGGQFLLDKYWWYRHVNPASSVGRAED